MTTGLLDATASLRACVVAFDRERVAIDVTAVREVVVFEDWTAVPLAPAHVIGVANLRGAVVPIVDAHGLLGLPPRQPERRLRTLFLAADGLEAAVVIDGIEALQAFGEAQSVPAGAPRHVEDFASVMLPWAGGTIPLLDAGRLLAALRPGPTS